MITVRRIIFWIVITKINTSNSSNEDRIKMKEESSNRKQTVKLQKQRT